MGKRHKKGITIYLDEHMPSEIKIPFQEMKLRTLEISKTKKYAGRNELEYIHELFSENAVFVTSDVEFIDKIQEQKIKHAGIVLLHKEIIRQNKMYYAELAALMIKGALDRSQASLHNIVIYPSDDGMHTIRGGKDRIFFSWDWLNNET